VLLIAAACSGAEDSAENAVPIAGTIAATNSSHATIPVPTSTRPIGAPAPPPAGSPPAGAPAPPPAGSPPAGAPAPPPAGSPPAGAHPDTGAPPDPGLFGGAQDNGPGAIPGIARPVPRLLGNQRVSVVLFHYSDSPRPADTSESIADFFINGETANWFSNASGGRFSWSSDADDVYWYDLGVSERDEARKCRRFEDLIPENLSVSNLEYRSLSSNGSVTRTKATRPLTEDSDSLWMFLYSDECSSGSDEGLGCLVAGYQVCKTENWFLEGKRLASVFAYDHSNNGDNYRIQTVGPYFTTQLLRTLVHEHLHRYGIGHDNGYSCPIDYQRLDQCEIVEYGNQFSLMGKGAASDSLSAINRYLLGWLNAEEILVVDKPGTFTVAPLNSTVWPRAVLIQGREAGLPDELVPTNFWVEYRQPTRLDIELLNDRFLRGQSTFPEFCCDLSSNTEGLMISKGTILIDARPQYDPPSWFNAHSALPWQIVRQEIDLLEMSLNEGSWTDSESGIRFSNVNTNDGNDATFDVAFTRVPDSAICERGAPQLVQEGWPGSHFSALARLDQFGSEVAYELNWKDNATSDCDSSYLVVPVSFTEPNGIVHVAVESAQGEVEPCISANVQKRWQIGSGTQVHSCPMLYVEELGGGRVWGNPAFALTIEQSTHDTLGDGKYTLAFRIEASDRSIASEIYELTWFKGVSFRSTDPDPDTGKREFFSQPQYANVVGATPLGWHDVCAPDCPEH